MSNQESYAFKIGDIKIKNRVVLAPMAGVCNSSFRTIIKEMGAGLIYSEMVSDKALVFKNKKTIDMLYIDPREKPIALQIFGSDIDSFVKAAKYIDKNTIADIIDINMGCPVPKITKNKAGAKMLEDPQKAYELVKAVVDSVDKPVTVKVRIGWDENNINILETAKALEKAGAKAIAIHGRTAKQLYSGEANWEWVKKVKEVVKIPVIGNGDIKDIHKAKEMLEYTKCDGIMIGRAALGNPFFIKKLVHFLESGKIINNQTIKDRNDFILKLANNLIKQKGEKIAMKEMRKHAAWTYYGIKKGKSIRNMLSEINTIEDLKKITKIVEENLNYG